MTKVDMKLFPSKLNGEIKAPPSKSLSHRAIICAALSKGRSVISNLIYSDDINATIDSLKLIGARFDKNGDSLIVHGIKKFKHIVDEVNCKESGSTLRFIIPIFSLTDEEVIFTGSKTLMNRPQTIYSKIFKDDDNQFEINENKIVVNGSLKPRKYIVKGDVSSQFFSGLMFALPLLDGDSSIYIEGELESKSYVNLTIDILEKFGITISPFENGYHIPGNQEYKPTDYTVEGDYSQASFHLVGGVLSGLVRVTGLEHNTFQGDKAIIEDIKHMKGKVIFMENGYITELSKTKGTTIDIADCPDLGPIISLIACLSEGTTHIKKISRLRIKESDRVQSTVSTLKMLGADIISSESEITINGVQSLVGGVILDSHNDHRIAMMISIAALVCDKEITLTNADAVNKSYPGFFDDYKALGGKYKLL